MASQAGDESELDLLNDDLDLDYILSSDAIRELEDEEEGMEEKKTFYPIHATLICSTPEEEDAKNTVALNAFAVKLQDLNDSVEVFTSLQNIDALYYTTMTLLKLYESQRDVRCEIPIKIETLMQLPKRTRYTLNQINRRMDAYFKQKARISDSNTMLWEWTPEKQADILNSDESNWEFVDVLEQGKVKGRAALITQNMTQNQELKGNYTFFKNAEYTYTYIVRQFIRDCRDAIRRLQGGQDVASEGKYSMLVRRTAELRVQYNWNVETALNNIALENDVTSVMYTEDDEYPFLNIAGNEIKRKHTEESSSEMHRLIPERFEGKMKHTNVVPVSFYREYMMRTKKLPTIIFSFETYIFDYFMNTMNEFWGNMSTSNALSSTSTNEIYGVEIISVDEIAEEELYMDVSDTGDVTARVNFEYQQYKSFCMYSGQTQEFYNPEKEFTLNSTTEKSKGELDLVQLYDENFKDIYGSNKFACRVVRTTETTTTYKIDDKRHDDAMEFIGKEFSDKVTQTEKYSRRKFIAKDRDTLEKIFDIEKQNTGISLLVPQGIRFPVLVMAPYGFDCVNEVVLQIDGQVENTFDFETAAVPVMFDADRTVNIKTKFDIAVFKLVLTARMLHTIQNKIRVEFDDTGNAYANGVKVLPFYGSYSNMIVPRYKFETELGNIDFYTESNVEDRLPYGDTPHFKRKGNTFQLFSATYAVRISQKKALVRKAIKSYYNVDIDFKEIAKKNKALLFQNIEDTSWERQRLMTLCKHRSRIVELNIVQFPIMSIKSYIINKDDKDRPISDRIKYIIQDMIGAPLSVAFVKTAPTTFMSMKNNAKVKYNNKEWHVEYIQSEYGYTTLSKFGFLSLINDSSDGDASAYAHRTEIERVKIQREKRGPYRKRQKVSAEEVQKLLVQLRF